VIKRAIATVIEAEQSGGNIEDVLTSITESLVEIKKIAQQRKASIQGQIIQSYIVFFVFLGVMIVIQNLLIPYIGGFSAGTAGESISIIETQAATIQDGVDINLSSFSGFILSLGDWFISLGGRFLMHAVIQGFFAGLATGKMSEGTLASGLKHSVILVFVGYLIFSLASLMPQIKLF